MIPQAKIDLTVKNIFDNIEFTKEPENLYNPLRYMIEIGGKRLRPRLCLTTYGLYKDSFNKEILEPATGLEVFHSFTLIHDDIMDRSPLRRGKVTVWKKWDEDTAILSGDVMCIDSYKRIAKAPAKVLPKVLDLFSTTAAQVCDGQQLDMDFESVQAVPMADYMKMIGLKTGVLIACASKMGALIGEASEKDCENLYQYGYNLGLAFQVEDDLLDAYGDEKVFGKPIGGDIINNKKCWLTTYAIEQASEKTKAEIFEIMSLPVDSAENRNAKVLKMKALYEKLGVQTAAKEEIKLLTNKALEYASKVCSGIRYETLRRFAESLVGRTY